MNDNETTIDIDRIVLTEETDGNNAGTYTIDAYASMFASTNAWAAESADDTTIEAWADRIAASIRVQAKWGRQWETVAALTDSMSDIA